MDKETRTDVDSAPSSRLFVITLCTSVHSVGDSSRAISNGHRICKSASVQSVDNEKQQRRNACMRDELVSQRIKDSILGLPLTIAKEEIA